MLLQWVLLTSAAQSPADIQSKPGQRIHRVRVAVALTLLMCGSGIATVAEHRQRITEHHAPLLNDNLLMEDDEVTSITVQMQDSTRTATLHADSNRSLLMMVVAILSCSIYVVLLKHVSNITHKTSNGIMLTNSSFSLLALTMYSSVCLLQVYNSHMDGLGALCGQLAAVSSMVSRNALTVLLASIGGFLLHLAITLNTTWNGPLMQVVLVRVAERLATLRYDNLGMRLSSVFMQAISGQLKSSTTSALGLLFVDDVCEDITPERDGCSFSLRGVWLLGLALNWIGSVWYAFSQYKYKVHSKQE